MKLRRSPTVVCFWSKDRFVVGSRAASAGFAVDPFAVWLLDQFSDWTESEDVVKRAAGVDPGRVRTLINALRITGYLDERESQQHVKAS
jgi:hypothetical protein